MNFQPTDMQLQIAQVIRDFGKTHIQPHVLEWDETQTFPVELFKKNGRPGADGSAGTGNLRRLRARYLEYVTVISEVSRICGAVGLSLAAHNSLCTGHILQFGSEAQKQQYLPRLATAEWIGAWGLTEPNTGSDAMNMKCTARKEGDEWVINGTKCWITHGKSGDVAVVIARTGELRDSRGMSAFIVERGTPGFSGGKKREQTRHARLGNGGNDFR